jgi:hypothetical protein
MRLIKRTHQEKAKENENNRIKKRQNNPNIEDSDMSDN